MPIRPERDEQKDKIMYRRVGTNIGRREGGRRRCRRREDRDRDRESRFERRDQLDVSPGEEASSDFGSLICRWKARGDVCLASTMAPQPLREGRDRPQTQMRPGEHRRPRRPCRAHAAPPWAQGTHSTRGETKSKVPREIPNQACACPSNQRDSLLPYFCRRDGQS